MLGEVLHTAPERIVFTYTESGKPQTQGAFFSVSHSGDVVACAVSDREVGLDVEQLRPVPQRLAEAAAGEDFWQLWTRREAAIKCRGGTLGQWKREVEDGLFFTFPEVPEGYVAALCEKE
jgi:4'-phosphopantetheinyl transferase